MNKQNRKFILMLIMILVLSIYTFNEKDGNDLGLGNNIINSYT